MQENNIRVLAMVNVTGRAKGGVARSEKLSPERRSEIARIAALAKKKPSGLPKAIKSGQLVLGDISIPCCVLDDGRRVLSERGITDAFFPTRPNGRQFNLAAGAGLPVFIAQKELSSLILKDYWSGAGSAIKYLDEGREFSGFEASALPAACEIWLKARQLELLTKSQLSRAEQAEIVMRALAHIGIVALVDEATGYQEIRPQDALQKYLEAIISKELAVWVKKFPDEFYENIYKLRGWKWTGMSKNRYSVVAHYTRDLVYERMAPGLLKELETKSPKDAGGNRENKLHQWLTGDIGDPMLASHIQSILTLQRLAIASGWGWTKFMNMVDKVLKKKGDSLDLPFEEFELP
ncbi:P63C domain-containing protein [Methylobacillus pratensis]